MKIRKRRPGKGLTVLILIVLAIFLWAVAGTGQDTSTQVPKEQVIKMQQMKQMQKIKTTPAGSKAVQPKTMQIKKQPKILRQVPKKIDTKNVEKGLQIPDNLDNNMNDRMHRAPASGAPEEPASLSNEPGTPIYRTPGTYSPEEPGSVSNQPPTPDKDPTHPRYGNGCFIATAAYGTPMAQEIHVLKKFRDDHLKTNWAGQVFVAVYNSYSPPVAEIIADSELLRVLTRGALYPVVLSAKYPRSSLYLMGVILLVLAAWMKRRGRRTPRFLL